MGKIKALVTKALTRVKEVLTATSPGAISFAQEPPRIIKISMDSSADLICLSYCSRASFAEDSRASGIQNEVKHILLTARRVNRKLNITGVLYFGEGLFFQYLEGPADNIDRLYAAICRDNRHHDVQRLTRRPVGIRRYSGWSMKYVGLERLVCTILQRHGIEKFDPYQFTPAIVDDLVVTCTTAPEHAPEAELDFLPKRRGFLSRWLS